MTRLTAITRRLLVVLLVPVFWLGVNPHMASAATGSLSLDFSMDRFGPDVTCAVSATYGNIGTDGVLKTGRGWCQIATSDGVPGTCSILEADCTTYQLEFTGCESYNRTLPDNDGSAPWPSVRVTLEPATISLGNCVPSQVCLSFHTSKLLNDQDGRACQSVEFEVDEGPDYPPPVDAGTCKWGAPFAIAAGHVDVYQAVQYKDKYRLNMLSRWPTATEQAQWTITAAHNPDKDPVAAQLYSVSTGLVGTWADPLNWSYEPTGLSGSHPSSQGPIWGVQVTSVDSPGKPRGTAKEMFGYTSQELCSFYFGPKVRNGDHPIYGDDEPYQPLEDWETPPPEEVPDPDDAPEPIWDPGPDTDLGGFGGLLKALQALLEAIGDLVGALLDGIKALFVPDRSSWGWGELRDTAKTKPPFSLISVLYDESRAVAGELEAAGGCSGFGDFSANGHDMNLTCARVQEGGMGALYDLVAAGLIGLTGFGLFRMVSGYFEKNG